MDTQKSQSESRQDGVSEAAVGMMLEFQRSGTGFEALWERIRPYIDGMVRGRLRTRLVHRLAANGRPGGDDEDAVGETVQQVSVDLLELPGKPASWFVPPPGSLAADALRGWLFGFCRTNVDKYCRTWRGVGRKRKVFTESALPLGDGSMNPLGEQAEFSSILRSAPAKIEVQDRELQKIVNECVDTLPVELRTLIRLNFWEGLSVRALDRSLGINVSTVQRRLHKARKPLQKELERRGIDASWLGPADGPAEATVAQRTARRRSGQDPSTRRAPRPR